MYDIAIALSLIINFILYEAFGLLSGGMISAGYLSLYFEQPLRIVFTLLLAIMVCLIIRLLSKHVILYGRRRFMLILLMGLIFGWLLERFLLGIALIPQDIRIIGHLIPGLIANDMYKQGIPKTLLTVLLSAALVRLVLMVVSGL
ncbi:MAG: poly-gamma-glutamate biosynthesis protein PgsC [Clostridiales bacterium]|nr:poly-gamma-glutamate biosynthesis protein PgsC [Clostridiales bacterium]